MILGRLAEVKHPKAIEIIAPMIDQEPVSSEACQAAVRVARDVWEKADAQLVKATLTKVTGTTKNDDQKRAAKEVLDKIEAKQKKKPA